jgi:phosphate transport system substrate-binding protein
MWVGLRRAAGLMLIVLATLLPGRLALADDPTIHLTAAGATFPQPLYETMIAEFMKSHPNAQINYGGGGSGQGINGITDRTLAFAGSDAPMNKQELAKAGGADNIVQIPSCAGAIVPAFNIPGVTAELKFTGQILADIYLGKITDWNDAQIAQINPGVNLPDLAITPAYRSDGSGTTYVWTNYLATQSDDFTSTIGVGKAVKWPIGQGGNGNPGVAAIVKQTAGAIGYVEQNYADKNGIAYGSVRNSAGRFVKASTETVSNAGADVAEKMSGHVLRANLWNQAGDDVYPISSLTYLIARRDLSGLKSREEAQTIVDFFWYATHDGQKLAGGLFYAPLAPGIVAKDEEAIGTFMYQGQPVAPQR